MKLTLDWLARHLETAAPLDEIVSTLNRIGLEVDNVADRRDELAPFTVCRVRTVTPHPDADRLRVCLVETAGGDVQVVCGAPNARAGMKAVFAPAGSRIPGTGMDLEETEIRGVASRGMLCSEREIGLSDEHEGIVELPADATPGESFAALSGLDDPVLDLSVTPDRGDCFSVRGIARDLAAAGLGVLKPLDASPVPGTHESPLDIELRFDESVTGACSAFLGRSFRGLTNGASPAWMQRKLRAVGLRPISALVDITNWVTMDLGRPAHIYDADKVRGVIGARLGTPGEAFDALNGKRYRVSGEMTVIFDDSGVLGLGGVIGGESTSASGSTVNGFLEIALFDPVRTAATGRELGLVTDARQRFERGIDDAFAPRHMEMVTRLILDICGGEASHVVTAGAVPAERRAMSVRPSRIETLCGIAIARERAAGILNGLGYEVRDAGEDSWSVTVPTWRHDMQCEADVIEEILRIHGFDKVPMVSLPRRAGVARPALSAGQNRVRGLRRVLADRGLNEAVTYSFIASRQAAAFGGGGRELVLVNPISSDMDAMRPSLLPGLLSAAARNRARGMRDLALFEIGPVYETAGPDGQRTAVTALRAGLAHPRHWDGGERAVDAFDAKADALAALDAAGLAVDRLHVTADAPAWFHPGRSGVLRLGPTALAAFGELHPRIVEEADAASPVVGMEIRLEDFPERRERTSTARPALALSPYQPVHRDFAFVLDSEVPAEDLVRSVRGVDRKLIEDVTVFDVYEGAGLGEGRKSVAVAVTLQPVAATMTEDELDEISGRIVAAVARRTGGSLRKD